MAFTSPRFEFGHVGGRPYGGGGGFALRRRPTSCEAPATGTATTAVAPKKNDYGDPICYARAAAADIYVAVGTTPNPSAEPRTLVRAGTEEALSCDPGDAAAWIPA